MKLALVMIVKNEASNIADVIQSVAPAIDRWCILDTGSTDGTQDVIRKTMVHNYFDLWNRGFILEEPFIDFATSRNRVIEAAAEAFPDCWQIMLSGTEKVSSHLQLINELNYWIDGIRGSFNAFHIEMRVGATHFPSLRIFNPKAGWRYKGRYHELLTPVDGCLAGPMLQGVNITYAGGEDKTESWKNAVSLLEQDAGENPEDGRPVFYLAEVHRCLGNVVEAYKYYAQRVLMESGYIEERAMSRLYMGRLLGDTRVQNAYNLTPDETDKHRVNHWLKGYALCPHRAEPLWELANFYHLTGYHQRKEELYALSYLYAQAAYEKPVPTQSLFVELPVYRWQVPDLVATHAWRFGAYKIGEEASLKAFQGNPDDKRVLDNYEWYKNRGKP